jgi:sulfoxide reductase heme-binding subunit YedZ
LLTILLSVLLVLLFGAVHENWSPMHRWNKATADASLVLLTMTMAVGPAARLWPHRNGTDAMCAARFRRAD